MTEKNKIFDLIKREEARQINSLMMIPSENYTYPEVYKAVGSILMSKYAEGQPKARYYQGMENVDELEAYCETLALKAFKLDPKVWSVNVQPYSGTPANLAIYNTLLEPGDKIMAMYLPDGGHLSHGWEYKGKKITLTSKIFKINFYHVDRDSKVFDYDDILKEAKRIKPKLLISGGTAYPREINHKKMAEIAKSVGAYYLADIAHEAGLVAAGVNSSPFKYADAVTMTTHKTLRGPRSGIAFIKSEFGVLLDRAIFPGLQGGPHMHTIAGVAVCLEKVTSPAFKKYAEQVVVNAKRLAQNLAKGGLEIVSKGTDKHLVLVDLSKNKVSGWFVAHALESIGIVANRNTVPYDKGSPFYPSGLRLGTPGLTVRGMKEKEIDLISNWILKVIEIVGERNIPEDIDERKQTLSNFKKEIKTDKNLMQIRKGVLTLCKKHPIN